MTFKDTLFPPGTNWKQIVSRKPSKPHIPLTLVSLTQNLTKLLLETRSRMWFCNLAPKASGSDGITNWILQADTQGQRYQTDLLAQAYHLWALMQLKYKKGGKDRHFQISYQDIYLQNTPTKLFEGLIESRLSKYTQLNQTLTPSQKGSRPTLQTYEAICALITTIPQRYQYGYASYLVLFYWFCNSRPLCTQTAPQSLTQKNYNIISKIWQLLKENS